MSTASGESPDPRLRFEEIATRLAADPQVSRGTGFGSSPGLRVAGKIFAMMAGGDLVVKLSAVRVDELVASGAGIRFDPGHGRLMKEWVTISTNRIDAWERLVDEAFEFVGSSALRST
jgi:hypothetical protein